MDSNIEIEDVHYLIPTNEEELEMYFKKMLTIIAEGNMLYIAHPNHVLTKYIANAETKVITDIDWNGIDIPKLRSIDDTGKYSIVNQYCNKNDNQLTFIQKKAKHVLKRYQVDGHVDYTYPLVIIEEIAHSNEASNYYIRGIISCTKDGFQFSFNPTYKLNIEKKSIWAKSLSFTDTLKK